MDTNLKFIGHIRTPYETLVDCPKNVNLSDDSDASSNQVKCKLCLDAPYQGGLLGLEVGQSILVLYWLDQAKRDIIVQHSCTSSEQVGTFSLRSPHRPNPIGASTLKIEAIDAHTIAVSGLDCLNGTPLLDIKPAR